MKKFLIVLEYELKEYFTNKGFMIFTILFSLLSALLLFLPRFVDLSWLIGTGEENVVQEVQEVQEESTSGTGEQKIMIVYDEGNILEESLLTQYFPDVNWVKAEMEESVGESVGKEEAEAGFVIRSEQEYDYYVFNKGMSDSVSQTFHEMMKQNHRILYTRTNGLDLEEITAMYEAPVTVNELILNKDTMSNYWYCYFLIIIVFVLIIMYGQMIAVSVTTEKSNRAIEVLVTSTTPESLLFGKVVAGAIGGLFQVGIIMASILVSYAVNREQWGGMLDMIFHIPGEVVLTFAFFGLGGYLFYAFLYGAMGALVSKTEDVSKSSGGLMVVIMVVYFISLSQLFAPDSIAVKVLSYLPISSYSTMFARIAMGTVAVWEILLSFAILVASIIGAGIIGAKIYRMGTLRYGNPIKLKSALRDIKNQK